jgi:lipid A 3-O-deacylase
MQIRKTSLLFVLSAVAIMLCTALRASAQAPATAVRPATAQGVWELGPFVNGGFGVGDRASYKFFDVGIHAGKVLTPPVGPGFLKGQFELAGELMPLWQAYTPAAHVETVSYVENNVTHYAQIGYGGGTFTGISLTPVILRWNYKGTGKLVPFMQGAGGLIWTNHKFPPSYLVPEGVPGGTSVWNFTPQFGVGFHYFVRPKRSISFGANAVHISSASLGDKNPGVNASVQLQLGYTWWKQCKSKASR